MLKSDFKQFIGLLISCFRILSTSAQECIYEGDIVFLLDGSDSISEGEFTEQKTLLEEFIRQSNIGPDNIRVGAIVVSSDIGDTISLAQSVNKNGLINAVRKLKQPQDGSRIDLGINQLERLLYSEGRPKVTQIGIIVTDGRSKYPDASKGESEALKAVGIHLFCVGVGRLVKEKQLQAMAFTPNEYFYIEPIKQSVEKLLRVTSALFTPKCKEATTTAKQVITTPERTTTTTTTPIPTTTTRKTTKTIMIPIIQTPAVSPLDALLNQQMKISVKSNLLNGKDVVGTKVEKMFSSGSDVPWWNTQLNDEQSYKDTNYQDQTWYTQADPVQAPWVPLPQEKSTPSAWRTFAPTPKVYQTYTSTPATDIWGERYRNPLAPVKLFSIDDMALNVFHYNDNTIVQKQTTTVKKVRPNPTTTTPTPTTTTKTTTMRQLNMGRQPSLRPDTNTDKVEEEHRTHNGANHVDLCYGSQYVDGVGYNSDPKSCSEFIQCFYEGGQIKVEKARCPFRMFWDQRLLLCRPSTTISCWTDPCFDFTVRSYDHKGNCRAHWSCRNGLSQAKCCLTGFSYSEEKQECIPDPGCTDWCEDSGELTFTSPFASCRMTPFETNERFYFEEIPGLGMMTRSCPRGSQYNPGLCTCDRSEEVRKESCRPELILDFQDGFNDKSGNNLAVTPENVHIESGAARFDGTGKIRLWRFSGVSYGSKFALTMRYKENPNTKVTEPMHLLSNCFNPEVMRPSIDIAISPNKGAMFLATTDKGGEQMAILKYNSTDWKTLSFVYDGKFLTGSVNGVKTKVPLRGVIEERPSALIIGACDYFGGYGGLMDDIKLYLCVPHGIT